MRRTLTEIISTMDQYDGMEKYINDYDNGKQVYIDIEMLDIPEKAISSKGHDDMIKEMLVPKTQIDGLNTKYSHTGGYVISYEKFISEQKGTPSNVQSYFGCLDDTEDLEEEE